MNTETALSIVPPLLLSLKISFIATVIAFAIGVLLAWLLAGKKSIVAVAVELIITIPMFIPPTVLGFYLLLLLGRFGPVGVITAKYFNYTLIFTQTAAVLAAVLAGLPFIFKTMKSFIETEDLDIIGSGRLDGANEVQLLLYIIMPLSMKGILTGVMLAFLRAMGEFGMTLMVAGNIPGETQTMSLAIYNLVMSGKIAEANFYAGILCFVSIIFIILIRFIDSKSSEAR